MKKTKKILLYTALVLLLLIGWGYFNIWRSPNFYMEQNNCKAFEEILSMKDYGNLSDFHERPYIYKTDKVLVFGSEHTKDPSHPQLQTMEEAYDEFQPTVIMVEGRLGFLIPYAMDPVKQFGEMGKAAALAKSDGIQLYSWDPPKSDLLDGLKQTFSPEQIAIKEILTPYFGNLRFGKPDSPEAFIEAYMSRAQWLGVQDMINSVEDIDQIWKRDFPSEKDWRDISDQWGLPGYLGQIADQSNYLRNQHLVCAIQKLKEQGERVFVVCGSSHAVCIENALSGL